MQLPTGAPPFLPQSPSCVEATRASGHFLCVPVVSSLRFGLHSIAGDSAFPIGQLLTAHPVPPPSAGLLGVGSPDLSARWPEERARGRLALAGGHVAGAGAGSWAHCLRVSRQARLCSGTAPWKEASTV